jgi:tetratricopeptide (TPR) repeat protein
MALVHAQRYTSEARDEVWLQKADAGAQLALKLNGQLALSQIASAAVLGRQRKFDPALAAYERALNLDPSNYFAWRGKVEALREARRYPAAQAALDEALRRFPDEAIFPIELGVLKYEQHDYPAAEQAFRRSIALQPDAVLPYANLNSVLLVQDRTEEAMRILQQGLQIRPSARLYSSLGNALFLRGDYTGAAEAFEHAVAPALRRAGRIPELWANLGDALNWLPGRETQARACLRQGAASCWRRAWRARRTTSLLVSRMGLYAARTGDSRGRRQALAQRGLDAGADQRRRAVPGRTWRLNCSGGGTRRSLRSIRRSRNSAIH